MALERPAKRRKTSAATLSTSFAGDDDDDELNYDPEEVQLRRDPGFHRAVAVHRLKSTFEHIFAKYEKDFSEVGDEIDLRTGRILVDNGHLTGMAHEKDTGEETDAYGSGSDEDEDEDEDEDRILGGSSKTLAPRDPRAMEKSLGSHAHEGRLSSIGASFLKPSRFSFGIWGARDGPLEAAWQAPALDLPDSNDFASALVQQKYDLPVRRGSESIWNPGPDTAADEEEPPPPQLPGPIIKRPVLPAIRAGTVFKTRVVPDGAAVNEEDDILLGPSATQCLAHAPRKSFHRGSGKIDEPAIEALGKRAESRETSKKLSPVGVQKRLEKPSKSAKSHSSPINASKPAAIAAAQPRRHSSGTATRLSDRPLTPTEPRSIEIVLARRPARQDKATWAEDHSAAMRHSSRRRRKTNFGNGVVAWKDVDSYYRVKKPVLVPSRFYIGIPTSDAFSRDDEAEYIALSDDSDPEPEPIVEVDHRLPTPPIQDDFDVMDLAARRLEEPKQVADRTIPDSQETMFVSSAISAAAASPPRKEAGSTALVEKFQRNEIDPSYAFSDDEDSIFIQKPKAPAQAVVQYETVPIIGRVVEEVSSSPLAPEKGPAVVAEFSSEVADSDSGVPVRVTRQERSRRRQPRPSEVAPSSDAGKSKAQEQIQREKLAARTQSLRPRQPGATVPSTDVQAQPETEPEDYAAIYEDFEHHHLPGQKTPPSKLLAPAPAQPSSKKSVRFSDLVEEQDQEQANQRALVLFSPRKTRSALAARPKQPAPASSSSSSSSLSLVARPAPASPETSLNIAGAMAARRLAESAALRHALRPVGLALPAPPATPSPAKQKPELLHAIPDSRGSSVRSNCSIMSLLPDNAPDDSDEDELTGRLDFTPRGGARLVRDMFALRVSSSGAKPGSSGGKVSTGAGVKRRRSSGGPAATGVGGRGRGDYGMVDRQSSPSESIVRTPGGTLRRCGVDGFVCERDFCFTCI